MTMVVYYNGSGNYGVTMHPAASSAAASSAARIDCHCDSCALWKHIFKKVLSFPRTLWLYKSNFLLLLPCNALLSTQSHLLHPGQYQEVFCLHLAHLPLTIGYAFIGIPWHCEIMFWISAVAFSRRDIFCGVFVDKDAPNSKDSGITPLMRWRGVGLRRVWLHCRLLFLSGVALFVVLIKFNSSIKILLHKKNLHGIKLFCWHWFDSWEVMSRSWDYLGQWLFDWGGG